MESLTFTLLTMSPDYLMVYLKNYFLVICYYVLLLSCWCSERLTGPALHAAIPSTPRTFWLPLNIHFLLQGIFHHTTHALWWKTTQ